MQGTGGTRHTDTVTAGGTLPGTNHGRTTSRSSRSPGYWRMVNGIIKIQLHCDDLTLELGKLTHAPAGQRLLQSNEGLTMQL